MAGEFLMYDTIPGSVGNLPAGGVYAGYVNGWYVSYPLIKQRFPHAIVLSIAVTAHVRARVLDVETGDASPDQVPAWLDHYAEGPIPIVYASASVMGEVNAFAGKRRFKRWSAHYAGEHICSPATCGYPYADATQFVDKQPQNYDVSLCRADFIAQGPRPIPKPPWEVDDEMISAVQNHDGRLEVFAMDKDGQIWHSWQEKAGGDWVGAQQGVRNAAWFRLGNPITIH